jgi:tetratricopeptide (TPR) repeat protein
MDSTSNGGADAELERLFTEAMADMQAGRIPQAVEKLEAVAAREPRAPNVWWNLGIMRAQLERHDGALAAWDAYLRLLPDDWRARAKVIQACQALGDTDRLDWEREALAALRRSGAHPELAEEPRFCREQFRVGDRGVVAYETFEPSGQRRVFYEFYVSDAGGVTGVYSLGSYDTTTEMMRELGNIGAEDRLYHLDWYEPQKHATHGFYEKMPGYEQVRADVVAALAGKAEPISSSRVPAPEHDADDGRPRATDAGSTTPPPSPPPPPPSPAQPDATRVATGGRAGGEGSGGGAGPLWALKEWLGRLMGRGGRPN